MPKIKNKIGSVSLKLFFASNVNPTTTGKIVINRRKSYLNSGPNVASPIKNFEGSTCITFGYIVSPVNTTKADIPIITKYDIKSRNFFLVEMEDLVANNNVIMK